MYEIGQWRALLVELQALITGGKVFDALDLIHTHITLIDLITQANEETDATDARA